MPQLPIGSRAPRAHLGLGLGVVMVSSAAILSRLAQAETHSLVVAAWRMTLATLILAPATLTTRQSEIRGLNRGQRTKALAAGLLLAVQRVFLPGMLVGVKDGRAVKFAPLAADEPFAF